ncbi:MAG TPA: M23 family metallopeptidase [Pseudonocardiaceae bacterium]|nr:M23 family metallopeptidase [Pseudonocardiaceae bacterium]
MSRILICALLFTVLSGGAGAGMVAATGLAVPPGTDEAGEPRRRTGMFGWPLAGRPAVVRAFEAPVLPYGPGHRGVDLASVAGAPVLAAGAGTVVFAGVVAGRGVVSVDHPSGLRTTYEPVSPIVSAGDQVTRGEQLGTVQLGHPGCTAAACLHWGVRRGPNEYLDPLRLVVMARVRLLPIDGLPTVDVEDSAGGGVGHLAP